MARPTPARLRHAVMIVPPGTLECTVANVRRIAGVTEDVAHRASNLDLLGLPSAVLPLTGNNTFLEIVEPQPPEAVNRLTSSGVFLDMFGPGGYMLMFQVDDDTGMALAETRLALARERIRLAVDTGVVGGCTAGLHLLRRDFGGATHISLDIAMPADAWAWAGPAWCPNASGWRAPWRPDGAALLGADLQSWFASDGPAARGWAERWARILRTSASYVPARSAATEPALNGVVAQAIRAVTVPDDAVGWYELPLGDGGLLRCIVRTVAPSSPETPWQLGLDAIHVAVADVAQALAAARALGLWTRPPAQTGGAPTVLIGGLSVVLHTTVGPARAA